MSKTASIFGWCCKAGVVFFEADLVFGGRVLMNVVCDEKKLFRTELAFVPHDVGHVLLDLAVLCLVLTETGAVFDLGVEPHGRHTVFFLADLAPVLAAVSKVIAVDAGASDVLAIQ